MPIQKKNSLINAHFLYDQPTILAAFQNQVFGDQARILNEMATEAIGQKASESASASTRLPQTASRRR